MLAGVLAAWPLIFISGPWAEDKEVGRRQSGWPRQMLAVTRHGSTGPQMKKKERRFLHRMETRSRMQ